MHIPVLYSQVLSALVTGQGGVYVDGTLGRAGHSFGILSAIGEEGHLIGIDRDQVALTESAVKLSPFSSRVHLVKGKHGDIADIVRSAGFDQVDGVLLDLGVSSPQLDEASRGFSFRADGPLDMRMDTNQSLTAAEVIATLDEEALTTLFRTLGEEPQAKRIARAIVRLRSEKSITTTLQLADLVERVVGRHGAHHPATRVFQALRMQVNDEVGELERALVGGLDILREGGRFAVITFESVTDRIVKQFFVAHAGREVSLQQGGARWEGDEPRVRLVTRRAIKPTEAEMHENARSRSAKLRVIERIG